MRRIKSGEAQPRALAAQQMAAEAGIQLQNNYMKYNKPSNINTIFLPPFFLHPYYEGLYMKTLVMLY